MQRTCGIFGGGGRAAKKIRGLVFCKQPMWLIFAEIEHSLWWRWRLDPCFWVLFPNKREIKITWTHHESDGNKKGHRDIPFSQLWMLYEFQSLLSGHSRLHMPALCCQRRWRAFSVDGSGAQIFHISGKAQNILNRMDVGWCGGCTPQVLWLTNGL